MTLWQRIKQWLGFAEQIAPDVVTVANDVGKIVAAGKSPVGAIKAVVDTAEDVARLARKPPPPRK